MKKNNLSNDVDINVSNTATTGTSSVYSKTNNSANTGRLYMNETGYLRIDNNSINGLRVYSNGVLSSGQRVNNKLFVLYDTASSEDPLNATSFFGFGVNSGLLRYQVPTTAHLHRFFCGSAQVLDMGATSATFARNISAPNINATTGITTGDITIEKANLNQRCRLSSLKHISYRDK